MFGQWIDEQVRIAAVKAIETTTTEKNKTRASRDFTSIGAHHLPSICARCTQLESNNKLQLQHPHNNKKAANRISSQQHAARTKGIRNVGPHWQPLLTDTTGPKGNNCQAKCLSPCLHTHTRTYSSNKHAHTHMPAHRTCTKSYATYAAGSDTSCALTEIKHEKCSSWQQAAGSSCTCCCCYCGSCSANWQPATATGQKQLNMLKGGGCSPALDGAGEILKYATSQIWNANKAETFSTPRNGCESWQFATGRGLARCSRNQQLAPIFCIHIWSCACTASNRATFEFSYYNEI